MYINDLRYCEVNEFIIYLQGRIVNNNTAPSGASSSPSLTSSQSTPTTTTLSSVSRSQQKPGNATNLNEYYNVQTQFLIHEEGGLERWFNLTITNVGLESVADYTCVAVNAGGVMEENISLTFEEPDPVSLHLQQGFNKGEKSENIQ